MVITRTVEMHAQLVGYDFKKKGLPTDKNIAVENSKVSNDYFWKTNKYTDQDVFGRTLDLTALINKPDGYLKGSLSDTEDVDYYEFNITEYRALSFAKDTYNKDITITLDHIPEIMYIKLMIQADIICLHKIYIYKYETIKIQYVLCGKNIVFMRLLVFHKYLRKNKVEESIYYEY